MWPTFDCPSQKLFIISQELHEEELFYLHKIHGQHHTPANFRLWNCRDWHIVGF